MAILGIIIGLVLLIAIFIFMREVWCWYWKINDLLDTNNDILNGIDELLEESKRTNKLLRRINNSLSNETDDFIDANIEK